MMSGRVTLAIRNARRVLIDNDYKKSVSEREKARENVENHAKNWKHMHNKIKCDAMRIQREKKRKREMRERARERVESAGARNFTSSCQPDVSARLLKSAKIVEDRQQIPFARV